MLFSRSLDDARSTQAVLEDCLLDRTRVIERTLVSETVVRIRLEPLGEPRVRVLEYRRKSKSGSWQRCVEEEGKVTDYQKLELALSYTALFGEAGKSAEDASRAEPRCRQSARSCKTPSAELRSLRRHKLLSARRQWSGRWCRRA